MPSPHSGSSHSSSSSSGSHSPSSHSSSSHSSSYGSSHSSSHSSWSSSRSSDSSYSGTSYDDDDDSNLPAGVQLVILVISIFITLIVFGVRSCDKNSSSRVAANASPYDAEYRREDDWVYYGNGSRGKVYSYDRASGRNSGSSPAAAVPESTTEEQLDGDETDTDLQPDDLPLFGRELRLRERVPGVFRISDDAEPDRILIWDDAEQSCRDAVSDLWHWYNVDMEPPLWQYRYEPISGDYGTFGWMEYEAEKWYIEVSAGEWIPVPERCDTSVLWHIESEDSD